ncbi:MAG: thiamine pyrophosphate-dependent enzyme, partial [Candidatus Atribacteria bacterium]|nr:thiamine pyrophosphate-dependent enzyme [Candidatus Atribacteria bacterium]
MNYRSDDVLHLYQKMLEIRYVDEHIVPLKLKDLVMDGFHPYAGEEAVAAGVCASLKPEDFVVSTHRPQGHAMAKGASPRSIFCEMLGRMGGPSNGTSGPMQWVDADHNFFCGSIVGSGSCYANGFALS